MKLTTLSLVLAVAAFGCGNSVTGPSDLVGVTWRLASIEPDTGAATVVTTPERYTLTFLDDTQVSVRADCNTCNGRYQLTGETLTLGPLACTRAFCGAASLETTYTRALDGPLTVSRDQSLLTLRGPQTTLRFRID